MNREILNLKNLSVSYGDINILKDIDLSREECRKFRIENSSFNDIDIDIHFENRNIFLKSNSTYHTNIKKEGLELWTA